jgi:hypothetical protein
MTIGIWYVCVLDFALKIEYNSLHFITKKAHLWFGQCLSRQSMLGTRKNIFIIFMLHKLFHFPVDHKLAGRKLNFIIKSYGYILLIVLTIHPSYIIQHWHWLKKDLPIKQHKQQCHFVYCMYRHCRLPSLLLSRRCCNDIWQANWIWGNWHAKILPCSYKMPKPQALNVQFLHSKKKKE